MPKLRGRSGPNGQVTTAQPLEPMPARRVDPPTIDGRATRPAHEVRESLSSAASNTKRVILIDENAFSRECITKCLQTLCDDIVVLSFSGVQQYLSEGILESSRCLVLFNIHGRGAGEDAIERDLASLMHAFDRLPLVLLSDVDRVECVQEAFERGARGYIPTTSTTLEVAIEIIRLVRAGGTFMPANGPALYRMSTELEAPRSAFEQHFTPRQMAVLHHLRQGKANKIIAHELAMSESTVKVHVRNIMRKMRATNRTEVAFRLHRLAGGLDGEHYDDR